MGSFRLPACTYTWAVLSNVFSPIHIDLICSFYLRVRPACTWVGCLLKECFNADESAGNPTGNRAHKEAGEEQVGNSEGTPNPFHHLEHLLAFCLLALYMALS